MKPERRGRLEADGYRVGSVQDLLGLDDAEVALIEIKLSLASSLRERRRGRDLTQAALAGLLGTSQSRVARLEQGDCSFDQLVRALMVLGVTRKELGALLIAAA